MYQSDLKLMSHVILHVDSFEKLMAAALNTTYTTHNCVLSFHLVAKRGSLKHHCTKLSHGNDDGNVVAE